MIKIDRKSPTEYSVQARLSGYLFLDPDTSQYVAYCRELDLSSCGRTPEEALKAIHEAQELFFESCIRRGVLDKALQELGWVCSMPTEEIVSCDSNALPTEVPPAFVVDAIDRKGSEWSTTVSWGKY